MFGYLADTLISFFKFMREWITGQPAVTEDVAGKLPIELPAESIADLPVNCPKDLFAKLIVDLSFDIKENLLMHPVDHLLLNPVDELLVDSLLNLQNRLFLSSNRMVKKLNRENIEILNHIINIKVSDLIERMNNKYKVPFYTAIQASKLMTPYIQMNGVILRRWFENSMLFNPDEAMYLANLLSSHTILFTLVNHYLIELNIGCFYRLPINNTEEQSVTTNADYKSHLNDHDYAIYLCKRATEENFHGDLLSYEVEEYAKAKVDVEKWKFKLKITNVESIKYNIRGERI